jgi:peroxisomal 2,4-dienoyl-CoA reductase
MADGAVEPPVSFEAESPLRTFAPGLFRGRLAIVTGGGSGIGRAIADALCGLGCSVGIVSRNKARLERTAAELCARWGAGVCVAAQADVRDFDSTRAAFADVLSRFPGTPLFLLVNSAAGNFLSAASQLSPRAFRTVLEIDLLGTFHACRAAWDVSFQHRREAQRADGAAAPRPETAVIVNISATLHYRGDPLQAHAGSAKAAIDALGVHLAREWGEWGVRVVGVAPGPTSDTEGYRKLAGFLPDAALDRFRDLIPLRRLASREDIAAAVVFAASPAASYLTGTTVVVDGGHWMSGATDFLLASLATTPKL